MGPNISMYLRYSVGVSTWEAKYALSRESKTIPRVGDRGEPMAIPVAWWQT